jgi:hypothetical protein
MAVYKLFPVKDATLYSGVPNTNTGLDQIIELSNTNTIGGILTNASVVRFLTAFDQTQINNIFSTNISSSQWQANLKCYLANGSGVTSNTNIFVNPLAQNWDNGTGTYSDSPATTNGVSWKWATYLSGSSWTSSNFGPYITASFQSSNPGGGIWYTGSSNTSVVSSNIQTTQSFDVTSIKDLNVNVTDIVKLWNSSSISNYGFIVRLDPNLEFNPSASAEPNLKYFSVDTHTIYPPQLEIKWNDFYWNTGSSIQTIINNNQLYISLAENPGTYYPDSINRFNLNIRPKYPPRVYQTASEYLTNYYLPTASYYAVKDLDTNEYVIDFDTTYTKLNADNQCNYFTLYMNGLEPERYYKILIKTVLNGSTLILDNDYYFKIINS